MEKFYYLRHAQTDAHIQRKLCGGAWDLPLNDFGRSQAKQASIGYAEHLKDIAVIYSSPLQRAMKTADAFAQQLQVPLVIIKDLREWHLGDWDQKPWDEVPDLFSRKDDPPNGETQQQFTDRIAAVVTSLISRAGTALIISHGAVWYKILYSLNIERQPIPSCVLKSFYRVDRRWFCE
jgi:broad specificity phosphatase PhoE